MTNYCNAEKEIRKAFIKGLINLKDFSEYEKNTFVIEILNEEMEEAVIIGVEYEKAMNARADKK